MISKGFGMLSSAEVANLLGNVGTYSPQELLKFRRLELLFSAIFQSNLMYNRTYDYFHQVSKCSTTVL